MNRVIVTQDLSLSEIFNIPTALGNSVLHPLVADGKVESIVKFYLNQPRSLIHCGSDEHEVLTALGEQLKEVDLLKYLGWFSDTGRREEILIYKPTPNNKSDHDEELVTPELVVYFPSSTMSSERTFAFWEHPTLQRIPGWILVGRYYGYPECCIKTFMDRIYRRGSPQEFAKVSMRSEGYPCLVCEEHAQMSITQVEQIVQAKRRALYTLAEDSHGEDESKVILGRIHYLYTLQSGKLTANYNLGVA